MYFISDVPVMYQIFIKNVMLDFYDIDLFRPKCAFLQSMTNWLEKVRQIKMRQRKQHFSETTISGRQHESCCSART